jgi:hypothetical protein
MSYIVPKEIPKNCFACPCGYETEGAFSNECQVLAREYEKDAVIARPNWCPLIEIPTPHGDLVDRTELLAEYDRQHKGPAGGARRIMEQATAIIKAEE